MIFDQTNFYSKIYRRKYIRNKSFHRDVYLNGCYQFPFLRYWPTTLCYEPIASVMPMKQNELQQKYLHTVDNTFYNQYKKNKPFKIRLP